MDDPAEPFAPTTRFAPDGLDSPEDGDGPLVDRLCADQLERWRDGRHAPVEEYLGLYPELGRDDEAQFELIYNEFLVREELGEPPTADELIGRFPRFSERLLRQLDLHRALRANEPTDPERHPGESRASAPPDLPGYDVLEEIGRGGMGVVYKARQRGLGRLVALKVIRPWLLAEPGVAARFRAEAETAARFGHPNIVQVHQVGEHDGQGFLALEYAPGGSLQRRLASGPMNPRGAAGLVEALARAAEYAHGQGVVHRDLKPANVVLAADGSAKITDFGLAKLMEEDGGLTRTGDILGTPSYMAPEQARGPRRRSARPPTSTPWGRSSMPP